MATNCDIQTRKSVLELFTPDKLEYYNNLLTLTIGDVIKSHLSDKKYSIRDVGSKEVVDMIYVRASRLLQNTVALYNADHNNDIPSFIDRNNIPNEDTLVDIVTILQNYRSISNYHQSVTPLFNFTNYEYNDDYILNDDDQDIVKDEDNPETEDILGKDDLSEKFEEYDKTANGEDDYSNMHKDVKFLFNILYQAEYDPSTSKIKPILDSNNLPIPAPASGIYNRLISKVNDQKDEYELLQRLEDPELQAVIPELQQITEILNLENWDAEDNRSASQKELWAALHQTFSKPYINVEVMADNSGVVSINSDIKGNRGKIRNSWINNFNSVNIPDNIVKTLNISDYRKTTISPKNLIEPTSKQSTLNFLGQMGIQFSVDHLTQADLNVIQDRAVKIYSILSKSTTEIENPLTYTENAGGRFLINDLVQIEGKYSKENPTNSTYTANGELIYGIANDNNITVSRHHLNSASSLENLMERPPFMKLGDNPLHKHSIILSRLFPRGIRNRDVNISLNLISGKNENRKAKIIREFTEDEKLAYDFRSMLINGRSDIMRPETANSFFSIGLTTNGSFGPINSHYFPIEYYNGEFGLANHPAIRQQILNYLSGEIERVNSYETKKQENNNLPAAYGEFNIFYKLSPELQTRLRSEQMSPELRDEFFSEYLNVLNNEFEVTSSRLNQIDGSRLRTAKIDEKFPDFEQQKRAYFMNSLFQNIEYGILISGDPLFVADFNKRNKAVSSTGTNSNTSDTMNAIVRDDENFNNTRIGVYRDNSVDFLTYTVKDVMSSTIKDFFYQDKDYEVTDGQGIISFDFMQELLLRHSAMNDYTRTAFQYESLVYKDMQNTISPAERAEMERLEKVISAEPDLYTIPVVKAGYSGPLLNATVDGRAYDKFSLLPLTPSFAKGKPVLEKLMRDMASNGTGYIKFNTGSKAFKNKAVDLDKIKSSTPDRQVTNLLKIQIPFKYKQSTSTAIPTQLVKLVFSNLFNEGIANNDEVKERYNSYLGALSNIRKTQTEKVLADLGVDINNGTVNYKVLSEKLLREAVSRGYNSNVKSAIAYNETTGRLNGNIEAVASQEVEKLLTSILDKTLRRFKLIGGDYVMITNGLSPKLNFYKKGQKMEARISLGKEFSKLLNLPHPKGGIIGTRERLNQLLKDKKFVKQHEKSLTIVLDRVPTQELNSMDAAIIVEFLPSTMGNVIQLPAEAIVKSGSDFDYDKEKIILPTLTNNGYYYMDEQDVNAEIQSILDKRNTDLNNFYSGNLDENLREIRTYANSVINDLTNINFEDPVNQKELNLINMFRDIHNISAQIAYLESLTESSDAINDSENIDQLKQQLQSVEIQFKNKLNRYREEIVFNEINEDADRLSALYKMKFDKFGSFSNKILELYANLITDPNRFDELVSKNDTKELRDLATQIQEMTGESVEMPKRDDVFYPINQAKVFSIFFNAKNMLAFYAKKNTIQQLFLYSGAKLNKSVDKINPFTGEVTEHTLKLNFLSPEEETSVFDGEKINISKREDAVNTNKQKADSQSINATVDSAKDPWFALFNLSRFNIGIDTFLGAIGVPQETIKKFIAHPALVDLAHQANQGANAKALRSYIINKYNIGSWKKRTTIVSKDKAQDMIRKMRESKDIRIIPYKQIGPNIRYGEVMSNGTVKINFEKYELMSSSYKSFYNYMDMINQNASSISGDLEAIAQFYNIQNYVYSYGDINRYFNFDTNKIASLLSLKDRQAMREKLVISNILSPQDLDTLENKSIISSFKNDSTFEYMFNKFMPNISASSNVLYDLFNAYNSNFKTRNKKLARSMPRDIENDFIYSIVYNYGQKAKNGYRLLTSNTENFASEFRRFKKSALYKEMVKKFPVLSQFVLSIHHREENTLVDPDTTIIRNIQFLKPSKTTLQEEESYIYQLDQLYKDERTRDIMSKIFDIGLAQSGLSSSMISYRNFIPISYYKADFENALEQFSQLDEGQRIVYTQQFNRLFEYNNSQYFLSDNNSRARIKFYDTRFDTKFLEQERDVQENEEVPSEGNFKDAGEFPDMDLNIEDNKCNN